jgi:SAM-dependent methyltransferase
MLGVAGTAESRCFWDRRAEAWHRRASVINEHLTGYGRRGIEALGLRGGERVLDVGCGVGYCTVEIADLVGPRGQVVGVDLAPAMIAAARQITDPEDTRIGFRVADAQADELGDRCFDAAYAGFSIMLFTDPLEGLSNINRALKPGGRFAGLIWGSRQNNPWMYVPRLAAAGLLGIEPPQTTFSDDRHTATSRFATLLREAGFVNVGVETIAGMRRLSETTAVEDISILFEEGGALSDAWAAADAVTRDACYRAVMEAMEPYRDPGGWSLPGSALLGTASAGD